MPLSYLSELPHLTARQLRAHVLETPPPPSSEEVREELQGELDRVDSTGKDLCHLMGMTSTWGNARWEAGPTPDVLVPTFRVVVQGGVPTEEVIALIVRRLTKHGWSGGVASHEPILRLDAQRAAFAMRLTADNGQVRLKVDAAPVRLGRTLATWVLAGVYEEDEIA
ncbi:hypothetical protein C8046_13745 [Serinibacter arcticus]|uniref:Uncharacterized protein n=1 Tax=Serinibacter arcticus TaxID=1655435 RepID=A0A2U1ZX43_9MICO|nr:hypothetical protein [Serinibacter arcticus]PWD51549.1 hypothetical protein C8046_13745 [Serinibacter arcticus]